ncbi:SigE family RNA polymerase sigma factor [Kibdelosporangium philippinense]|uniref:SigE family RNA polymerase sigma factor n=1 Tax=Kibdelosporangium philippinense TaxID=211113 RepID=A0ABS8ZD61_9PSEU|nr:SigE family RNA polymerase sigma factor [Kibdelosporangium philippinense]MCE7004978.1 SigE family RNA polymerase sigma factor [Kibdelosporangium philippinense]
MARFDKEFAEFFSARFDYARRTAYAMCYDWAEAEELAQNAFVRLYSHWPRVVHTNPDAYLRTVVTRLFLDTRRRGRKREHLVAELPEQLFVDNHDAAEDRPSLIAALQKVPPKQRAVLVLRIVQDLSVEQVAEALRCSTGTVKSQTARGLKTLREAYEQVTAASRCA